MLLYTLLQSKLHCDQYCKIWLDNQYYIKNGANRHVQYCCTLYCRVNYTATSTVKYGAIIMPATRIVHNCANEPVIHSLLL